MRWLTASPAAQRVIDHFDAIKLYLDDVLKQDKKQEDSDVYKTLKDFSLDEKKEANICHLHFVVHLASFHKEYCRKLQAQAPSVVFVQLHYSQYHAILSLS